MTYSFDARATEDENAQTMKFRFVVNNGIPCKLGDGSFGSVFEARDPADLRCAVKLFYPTAEGGVTHTRNSYEMRAGLRVRQKLRQQHLEGLESNLALSYAWTDDFLSSEAYCSLKEVFRRLGIAVSNHALVMPYYECTLKDVLETGAPSGRLVAGEPIENQGGPGYEILRNVSVSERESHIVNIVSQVATGLRAVHAADLFHHDIKPANVMLRSKGDDVEVALADFGFLEVLPVEHTSGYQSALPSGTRHYRSPGQTDFFDVCEVSVRVSEGQDQLILDTADRKFQDTLMESGDVAVFSKDGDKKGYEVMQVLHNANGGSQIILKSARKEEFEDERTQVMLYKKPSLRTDVFGLGALLFDLLTVGRSPEGFYDHLRPFDRPGDLGVASVAVLVDRYRAAASATSTTADMAPLFDQVRDNVHGRFPSDGIVTILFRCMLSRKPDSYYGLARLEDGTIDRMKLFTSIQEDLRALEARIIATGRPRTSPLWTDNVAKSKAAEETEGFLDALTEMRHLPQPKRLLLASLRLRQLTRMIAGIHSQRPFFVDLGPGNLRFDKEGTEVTAIIGTYQEDHDYLRAVRSGTAWRVEASGDFDNYVPVYRRFDVRAAKVEIHFGNSAEELLTANVRYTESTPIWRRCQPRDLIRIVDAHGQPRLFEIDHIHSRGSLNDLKIHEIQPSNDEGQLAVQPSDPEAVNGTIIRRLNPMACYLSTLATYIHHLFFADETQDNGTIPDIVWSLLLKKTAGVTHSTPNKPDFTKRSIFSKANNRPDAAGVRAMVAWIYLELISTSENNDTHRKGTPERMLSHLATLTDELDQTVAQFCNINKHALTTLSSDDLDNLVQRLPPGGDPKSFANHLSDRLGPYGP